jgi:hypothetical protein
MIFSVHLADVGLRSAPAVLRRRPKPGEVPGLRYAITATTAPLGPRFLPTPSPSRVALVAAWDDDAGLDRFLAADPLAQRLAEGWMARLEPLNVYGAWAGLDGLPEREVQIGADEPVAVLTLGKPRLTRLRPFLRASANAEREAVSDPGMLASVGLARPPGMVATFSLWRNVDSMREYARGRRDGAHPAATAIHRGNPFHHESAFIRFRPYAWQGLWDGTDPLAEAKNQIAAAGGGR